MLLKKYKKYSSDLNYPKSCDYEGASVNGRKKIQIFFLLFLENVGEKRNLKKNSAVFGKTLGKKNSASFFGKTVEKKNDFFSAVHTCTIVCVRTKKIFFKLKKNPVF